MGIVYVKCIMRVFAPYYMREPHLRRRGSLQSLLDESALSLPRSPSCVMVYEYFYRPTCYYVSEV